MTILLVGGGSGGHITPILAVADELKRLAPDTRIVYVGYKGDRFAALPAKHSAIDEVRLVRAGKFRRYHGEGWKQLLDISTMLKNLRDGVYVLVGIIQSYRLLGKLHPSIMLMRGGFVGVPMGVAAHLRGVPYITHDSDAIPSLANRMIAKRAALHAVALPAETYSKFYPADKTVQVGVPVDEQFKLVTSDAHQQYRRDLGLSVAAPTLLVTGGGLGASRINVAVVQLLPGLLKVFPDLQVLHLTGQAHEVSTQAAYDKLLTPDQLAKVHVKGFVSDLHRYSGAADVIVARAGATNLAEFALQQRACIIVPNPLLTGGHQVENARTLERAEAVQVVEESQLPDGMQKAIETLMQAPELRLKLATKLGEFARPEAARDLATLLLEKRAGE